MSVPTDNPIMVSAALRLADLGYAVVPLVPGTKIPATKNGALEATTNEDEIIEAWEACPTCNIGLRADGMAVVDIDAGAEWPATAEEQLELSQAPMTATPHDGVHYFFRLPEGVTLRNSNSKIAPHVDLKTDGGYVAVEPSVVDGKPYRSLQALDVPREQLPLLPQFVLDAVHATDNGRIDFKNLRFETAAGAAHGSRRSECARLAGIAIARGAQKGEVLAAAQQWRERCEPSPAGEPEFTAAEVEALIEDLCRREFAKQQQLKQDGGQPSATAPVELSVLSAEEFSKADFRMRFLVKRVLVAGQPCIVGGAKKSLKTSLLCDLAISLGTSTPFLETFEVTDPVTVCVLSGESGPYTIRETAERVASSKGMQLRDSQTHWGFNLPVLSRADHLQALVELIRKHQFAVTIFDPAYLCLLDDGRAESAGNVFRMGATLRQFAAVGVETGTTLVLCHHATKAAGRSHEPMELEDLSQAGFAEFARQWLLLSRRTPFEYGSGQHKLWLVTGGSAGHSGLYGLDVDEGTLKDDFSGRQWMTSVMPVHQVIEDKATAEAEQKRREAETALRSWRQDIISALQQVPDGETKRAIREMTTLNSDRFGKALTSLIADKTVVPCTVMKANNRTYGGFKIAVGLTGTSTGTNDVPLRSAHSGTRDPLRGPSPTAGADASGAVGQESVSQSQCNHEERESP